MITPLQGHIRICDTELNHIVSKSLLFEKSQHSVVKFLNEHTLDDVWKWSERLYKFTVCTRLEILWGCTPLGVKQNVVWREGAEAGSEQRAGEILTVKVNV